MGKALRIDLDESLDTIFHFKSSTKKGLSVTLTGEDLLNLLDIRVTEAVVKNLTLAGLSATIRRIREDMYKTSKVDEERLIDALRRFDGRIPKRVTSNLLEHLKFFLINSEEYNLKYSTSMEIVIFLERFPTLGRLR